MSWNGWEFPRRLRCVTVLLTGFLTCLALIVAIGPQSAWLLRQGLRRDRVLLAVSCCLLGDIVLIALGTAGVGAVLDHAPWLLDVIRWLGVAYLLWFAFTAFRSAVRPTQGLNAAAGTDGYPAKASSGDAAGVGPGAHAVKAEPQTAANGAGHSATATLPRTRPAVSRVAPVVATGLTVSLLNPHAWVDTLVVMGSMANSFGDERWFFALGACVASLVWFSLLGLGGRALAPWLNRPRTWQVIDIAVGLTMLVVAGLLAFG